MSKISIFRTVFIALLLLLWTTGGVMASPPAQEPPGDVETQAAVSTAFTYQGNLADGSGPVTGSYDFEFGLFDAPSGGNPAGLTLTRTGQTVTAGLFSVQLDFGPVFNGSTALWLQINVRSAGDPGGYTPLSPRQPLTAAPYALYALDGWGGTWTGTGTGLTLGGGTHGLTARGSSYGVYAENESTSGDGVFGFASANSGTTYGVHGLNLSTTGRGVYGEAVNASGVNYGVYGKSASTDPTAAGVYGLASATSGNVYGVHGESKSPNGRGVSGYASATSGGNIGVYGESKSPTGYGVFGDATSTSPGSQAGVYGRANHVSGVGVYGINTVAFGVAGYFAGDVQVTGTLSKGGGAFKIDHPLDPENKYLYHSFVESPDMKNIYDGVVTLDENGTAWIQLADWFDVLNQEFRYQLTPIGAAMPDLYIAQEITDNGFQIAGGAAGLKVSWQVTGIRHDPYAEANRIQVEVDKSADERGTYLYPELYGQPAEMGLDYQRNPAPQDEP